MPEMKDSGVEWIGDIPNSWDIARLQFCLKEVNVKNNPIQTNQVLSLVKDQGVMPYEEKGNQGNKSKDDVSEYKLAYPETLVVNSMNILIGSVGLSEYFGCVSPVYYVFRETDEADLRFINYIFNTRQFQKELRKYANGILEIRLRVSAYDIFRRKVALPSKMEQKRISDFLDDKCSEINELINDIQSEIDVLGEYKNSVITEMFPEISTKKLKNIGTFQNGVNFNSTTTDEFISFLGVGDFKDNLILDKKEDFSDTYVDRKYSKSEMLQDEDIVFVRSNGSKELVGRAVMVKNIDYPLIYSGFCIRFRNNDKKTLSKYLLYFFRSHKFKEELFKGSMGTAINNLSQTVLGNINIPSISLDEQIRVVDLLDRKIPEIDAVISDKREQISILEEYKRTLIYEYVTGKKEVF